MIKFRVEVNLFNSEKNVPEWHSIGEFESEKEAIRFSYRFPTWSVKVFRVVFKLDGRVTKEQSIERIK